MEPPRYTAAEKGKGKAQKPADRPETPTSRQLSSPVYPESIPSPPTSPLQGARLPMNRRFPVRPTTALQSTSPAADTTASATRSARPIRAYMPSGQPPRVVFDPVPGSSHQVVRTVGSTDSIAESMIREFEYDPNDRTPPKRRMKVVAEVVKSAVDGSDPPVTNAHTSTLERQRAQQKTYPARIQFGVENNESSRTPPVSCMPASMVRLADIEAKLADNEAALQAAYDSVDAVYDRDGLVTGDRLCSIEGDSEEDSVAGPAASFLKSDAQRRFEDSRRLTILSEHTEMSGSSGDDDRSQDCLPSLFGLKHSNLSVLNILCPSVGLDQNALRKGVYAPTSSSHDPFADEDGVGGAGPLRAAAGSFFPAGSYQHPFANGTNLDQQPHTLPTPPAPAVRRAPSRSLMDLPPVQEVDSLGDSLQTSSNGSVSSPMRTENEKPPSVSPTAVSLPSVSSSSNGLISKCCSIAWYILAWAIPLAFLAGALSNMIRTRTFDEIPPGLFTAESKTLHSENQCSNLTMAWIGEHAVRFNVSAVVSLTSKPTEVIPNHWSFLLEWSADGDKLNESGAAADARVSAMPLPSFEEEFVRSMGLLGLFAAIFWIVSFMSKTISRCWHWREDGNVFWTRFLLRWFDKGRIWIDMAVAAITSALVWAAVSRALLLASV